MHRVHAPPHPRECLVCTIGSPVACAYRVITTHTRSPPRSCALHPCDPLSVYQCASPKASFNPQRHAVEEGPHPFRLRPALITDHRPAPTPRRPPVGAHARAARAAAAAEPACSDPNLSGVSASGVLAYPSRPVYVLCFCCGYNRYHTHRPPKYTPFVSSS